MRTLWLEPLFAADQKYAFTAARSLASPQTFDAPAEPDLASILPASPSPQSEDLVAEISRRFLSGLFPDAAAPAGASTAKQAGAAAAPRFARSEDFARKRKVADSTTLTRGSGGAAGGPTLKAFHADLPPSDP